MSARLRLTRSSQCISNASRGVCRCPQNGHCSRACHSKQKKWTIYEHTTTMLSHIYVRPCTSRSSSPFRMSRALERHALDSPLARILPKVNLTRILSLSYYFIKILTSRKKPQAWGISCQGHTKNIARQRQNLNNHFSFPISYSLALIKNQ